MKTELKHINEQTQPAPFEAMVGDIIIRKNPDSSIDIYSLSDKSIEMFTVKSSAGAATVSESLLSGQALGSFDLKNL